MKQAIPKITAPHTAGRQASFFAKKSNRPFFAPLFVQPKLTIGAVDEPYEREADAVADKVMRMSNTSMVQTAISPVSIQRKCAHCEEEEKLQRKAAVGTELDILQRKEAVVLTLQRKCDHCEEEDKILHRKPSAGAVAQETASFVHQGLLSAGKSMDDKTLAFMEDRFNYDFSAVRIHDDSMAHQSASSINALAYTQSNHVVFNAGRYQPHSDQGRKLLAHELTHVVQQRTANSLSANRVQRKEGDSPPELTRSQEIEQSIDTPGGFEVLDNPFGISIYNFAINRYWLKPEHKSALKKIGRMLISAKGEPLSVLILGNTDATGPASVNDPLSVQRAKAVRDYLRAITGVKYSMEGEGENLPITSNETSGGRTRNRRVEIRLDHPFFHHELPKQKTENGLILPPAYSYTVPNKIYRDDLYNKDQKSCPWPWSCHDIPWLPWLPIPKCIKLAIECAEGEDPEACYELYKECLSDDGDSRKRRACPVNVDLPVGDLPLNAAWPYMALKEAFWMTLDFKEDAQKGCFCSCGEYEQRVRGYFETEYTDGTIHRTKHVLTPGVLLEENVFHEDGDRAANTEYGHRNHPARFVNSYKQFFIDKFFPTQQNGCTYVGSDRPEVGGDIAQSNEVRRTWLLEFEGLPVDNCAIPGKRTPMESYKKSWRIKGEIVAPPPITPLVPKGSGGQGGGPGKTVPPVKKVRVTATRAKTNPSGRISSAYGGGIAANATVGQEYNMQIDFRISGKSEVFVYTQHVKIVEPTNADAVTVITSNEEDLNLAPPKEPEVVLKAHKIITIPRHDL